MADQGQDTKSKRSVEQPRRDMLMPLFLCAAAVVVWMWLGFLAWGAVKLYTLLSPAS